MNSYVGAEGYDNPENRPLPAGHWRPAGQPAELVSERHAIEEKPEATGLILVDIQNEYFPGGRMELPGIDRAAANAGDVLALFRDRCWPTVHVQHVSTQADAPLFTSGT